MSDIDRRNAELKEMDELAELSSPVHAIHPLAKLLTTMAYILITMTFGKYNLSGLMPMVLFPAFLFSLSGIPVRTFFYKLRFVLPLVCAVGLFNPLFDRAPMLYLGNVAISGGVLSMVTLMLKGIFCLMASFLLASTTSIDAICGALRQIRVPKMLVSLVLLTYRYVSVMLEEVGIMTTAYHLRAPGQKGIHVSAWGSFLGQLLLRSMDRAEELYGSMQLRGFCGEFPYTTGKKSQMSDGIFFLISVAFFIMIRCVDISRLIGGMIM